MRDLTNRDPDAPRKRLWDDRGRSTINPEWEKYQKTKKAELLKRVKEETKRKNAEQKEREKAAAKRRMADDNPEDEDIKPSIMGAVEPPPEGTYIPWMRPRKPGTPMCIFDDPPDMSDPARAVWDDMSMRIPDPDELGLTPEKVGPLLRYCYVQAWLQQQHFDTFSSEWERYSTKIGHKVLYPNPQFNQWLVASKHLTYLHNFLFDKVTGKNAKRSSTGDMEDDHPQVDNTLTAKDFPVGMRDAAEAAARMVGDKDISKLMPYAVVIGKKAGVKS